MTNKLSGALRKLLRRPSTGGADVLTGKNDDPARDQDTPSPEAALESGAARLDPDTGEPELVASESQRMGAEALDEKPAPSSETGRIGAEDYPDEGYPDGGHPDERSRS